MNHAVALETIRLRREDAVLFAEISAPPINLMGPGMTRDLAMLIQRVEMDHSLKVVVFTSADPDFFISHVDVTSIRENRDAAAQATGEASLSLLFRRLSTSRVVSIAQIEGRVRGVGSEFALACDMRFAARESALFSQFEACFGVIPGAGGAQHLARLMGRARALEVMLGGEDYDADLAERYGWINRALPAAEIGGFVSALAHRIAGFPAEGHAVVKDRVNAIGLVSPEELREDGNLFIEGVRTPAVHRRIGAALARGFQTRIVEMDLPRMLGGSRSWE
jgi:enoyl-CoA hydratase/carnithine racemase